MMMMMIPAHGGPLLVQKLVMRRVQVGRVAESDGLDSIDQ